MTLEQFINKYNLIYTDLDPSWLDFSVDMWDRIDSFCMKGYSVSESIELVNRLLPFQDIWVNEYTLNNLAESFIKLL